MDLYVQRSLMGLIQHIADNVVAFRPQVLAECTTEQVKLPVADWAN